MTTILVVDDCPEVLEILGAMLEGAGYTAVLTLEPGRAASISDEVNFDAALCDLYLPNDKTPESRSPAVGIDLISMLRRRHPYLPVIAMSGNPEGVDREDKRHAGFCAMLQKPFDRGRVVAVIESAIRNMAIPKPA